MVKVLFYAQITEGAVSEETLSLISKLSETFADGELAGVLIGNNIPSEATETLGKYGAKKVFVVEAPELETYLSIPYAKAMNAVIEKYQPDLVIAAGTVYGEDLIPRLAALNDTTVVEKISDIKVDGNDIIFYTPVKNDEVMITTKIKTPLKFAVARSGAFFINENPSGSSPEVEKVEVSISDEDFIVKHVAIKKAERTVNLKDAKVIVAGGRGVGGKEKFAVIRELAEVLGGEIGATRACTDVGWIEETYEIGQTGQSVSPDLYIAAGISGAPQHISGVKAKTLIAINTDESAPIFKYADYGIVGDLHTIIPILKQKLQES